MMTEISLNVLDVVQNSIKANAKEIIIFIDVNTNLDKLTIAINDDGCGMTQEQLKSVVDPFYTTRTTRKVGLGIPFFKLAAECSGGNFYISSEKNMGTKVLANFCLSSIDRMPLGDIVSTIYTLIIMNINIDFKYTYRVDKRQFTLDTKEFREILGTECTFDMPEISAYIKDFLKENTDEVNQGMVI